MKIEFSFQDIEVWMILPTVAIVYDPEIKQLEMGFYFLKYSLTIKNKKR